jgi:alanine dehydrogenase
VTSASLSIRILNAEDVRALLTMHECIAAIEGALAAHSRRETLQPVRSVLRLQGAGGFLGMMPGALGPQDVFGIKTISVKPGNRGTPYESHQGAVLLFEPEHGSLVAALDAAMITAIRTAAASAAATRALARPDASSLAILGSGTQAATHLEAMRAVRDVRRVRVWGRSAQTARAFAERESLRAGISVEPVEDPREAVEGADVICTVTGAAEPVLRGAWIAPGAHVNAVGACIPSSRELDTEAMSRARVFVDDRAAALQEAGDILIPIREGAFAPERIAGEIGAVIDRAIPGRTGPADITVFESLGLAIEDLAAARIVYRKAAASGRGSSVTWGGLREAG